MDKELKKEVEKLSKYMKERLQSLKKSNPVKDVLDNNRIAEMKEDSLAPDVSGVMNKSKKKKKTSKEKCCCEQAMEEENNMEKTEKFVKKILDNFEKISKTYLEKKEDRCWDGYEPTPGKKAYSKGSCQKKSQKAEKSEKPFLGYNKEKHSKEGGLSEKERKRINREEGSNLKPPVSAKEAKKSPKKAARRKSFCARMSGNKGPTSKDGKLTPKGAALKRWDC